MLPANHCAVKIHVSVNKIASIISVNKIASISVNKYISKHISEQDSKYMYKYGFVHYPFNGKDTLLLT